MQQQAGKRGLAERRSRALRRVELLLGGLLCCQALLVVLQVVALLVWGRALGSFCDMAAHPFGR